MSETSKKEPINIRAVLRPALAVIVSAFVLVSGGALATGACGSGDLIGHSSFETLPGYTISFTNDSSTVFTEAGQATEFIVEYLDESDQPLNPSSLEWCLADGSNLDITPDGLSAIISSTGFSYGSTDLVVPSNSYSSIACPGGVKTAGIRILGDLADAWPMSRRVWNQHAYHVSNVMDDGTIPTVEEAHYSAGGSNSFRVAERTVSAQVPLLPLWGATVLSALLIGGAAWGSGSGSVKRSRVSDSRMS